jgi:serine/threonine-protein kinase RsbW
MDCSTTIVIGADLNEVSRVAAAIDEAMRACAFSGEAILDLQLAVEEAIANTVIHGYRGAAGEVVIAIRATHDTVEVRIEDNAPPFDPLSLPEPDLGSDLDERRIGGLGVYLIRQVTDEVFYRYADGKNILTLVKRRAG